MSTTKTQVKQIFDYVCEIPTYTELDYDYQRDFFENKFSGLSGGCSATAKRVNGEVVIARNLDFNISNKSAYVVRTEVPGFHKTVGMAYIPWFGPDFKDAVKDGLDDDFAKILPFFCCDILNDKGFYIEADMRNEEHDENGKPRYKDYGLNPGKERVSAIAFLRYAAERCATIDDLLNLLKEIDFYSLSATNIDWGFSYVVADATGNFGVLEIAGDKVYFNQYHPCHTNSYVTPELAENQKLRSGWGRYNTLMANYFKATDEQGMLDLINLVRYTSQYEDRENCAFDWRHEYYDEAAGVTYDFLMDPANEDKVLAEVNAYTNEINAKTRQEKQDVNTYWESTLTVLTNVNKRTMRVRCYEDENRILNLTV